MNTSQTAVTNGDNLAFFMVNFSGRVLKDFRRYSQVRSQELGELLKNQALADSLFEDMVLVFLLITEKTIAVKMS